MRRLFTSFPDGWPGIGLLLLRCCLATELTGHIVQNLIVSGHETFTAHLADMLALAVGGAVLLGILTPLAAIASGIGMVAVALAAPVSHYVRAGEVIRLVSFASSVALIGPGAYSIDGLLFGRREIIVPRLPPTDRA